MCPKSPTNSPEYKTAKNVFIKKKDTKIACINDSLMV